MNEELPIFKNISAIEINGALLITQIIEFKEPQDEQPINVEWVKNSGHYILGKIKEEIASENKRNKLNNVIFRDST